MNLTDRYLNMMGKKQFITLAMVALAPLSVMADESVDYKTEMQQKMQSMTNEERQLFRNMNSEDRNNEAGGNRYGDGGGDGTGQQVRNRYGNESAGSGQGAQHRYGSQGGTGSGYGRGSSGRH
jgi:hypothetical protein